MSRLPSTLTDLARVGFVDLGRAAELLSALGSSGNARWFVSAADPDQALVALVELFEAAPAPMAQFLDSEDAARRLIRVLGASSGLGDFFRRHPKEVQALESPLAAPPDAEVYSAHFFARIGTLRGETAVTALRTAYRVDLARLMAWDLEEPDSLVAMESVAASLADLASAALDAALMIARRDCAEPPDEVERTRLAIVGMGKAGAHELNYVSDVDVIFVGEASGGLPEDRALRIATRLAMDVMRVLGEFGVEPALWEVDANLRPEGKDGALVRTLASHVAYYERWARGWEFQALLKACALAGDPDLGRRFVSAVSPQVWSSASREHFVESVQAMRGRVTHNIPPQELDVQLKLGPGGLRDVEFTTQLLQLVHGQNDPQVRQAGTLPALAALAERGYIGRAEAAEFSQHYRFLRVLEHRLQSARLRRTHLMPTGDADLRVLARASGLAESGEQLRQRWQATKREVRQLHERLFYRPLLSAVAALDDGGLSLSPEQARARLAAIGFRDPKGALAHIAALTTGVSRRAVIQRNLLPVMLQWLADGADPDYGLLAFRRLSENLGESYWFLRLLRDSSGVAQRLTQVLASSRYVGNLLEGIPEAAAWLENDHELRPRSLADLLEETRSTVARHGDDVDAAALALRHARQREVLRLALGGILGLLTIEQLGRALSDITTAMLSGALSLTHRFGDGIEFGIIAMGRYGGAEAGFGSDADILYVYRPAGASDDDAQRRAEAIVHELGRLTEDLRLPLELDPNLRPEGKNGAIVRSLDSYRAYYERWSLTWEAQALLRARPVAGDPRVLAEWEALVDDVRYPKQISERDVREVKRIKARVESERLPQGADPARHLKLGRGSLSDVEWFVQLLQLQHGARVEGLRTTSTLHALAAAEDAALVNAADAAKLRDAWILASRARSAMTLWTSRTSDVLPTDRRSLEGIARVLQYAPGSASRLEEDYLRVTRQARQVFEREFYGAAPQSTTTG